jgi:biopolymer transport protein ExbB/TolQ
VDPASLDDAHRRLQRALDALEAAVEQRLAADRDEAAMSAQIQALGEDRARLAAALDREAAHVERLDGANREVAARLELAMETIRTVLDTVPR